MAIAPVYNYGSKAIASYDFADIVNRTGYITLYPGDYVDGKGLVTSDFKSNAIATYGTYTGTSQAAQLVVDQDFDILLDRPMTLKGYAYVQMAFLVKTSFTSDGMRGYLVFKLRKWDGTTETEIASVNCANEPTTLNTSTNDWELRSHGARMNISTATLIKKGEYLRLTVEGYTVKTTSNNSSTYMNVYCDPSGSLTGYDDNGGNLTSSNYFGTTPLISTLALPTRIDL